MPELASLTARSPRERKPLKSRHRTEHLTNKIVRRAYCSARRRYRGNGKTKNGAKQMVAEHRFRFGIEEELFLADAIIRLTPWTLEAFHAARHRLARRSNDPLAAAGTVGIIAILRHRPGGLPLVGLGDSTQLNKRLKAMSVVCSRPTKSSTGPETALQRSTRYRRHRFGTPRSW
jgi:hypothetical protein